MRSWFGPAPAVVVFALVAVAMMTVGAGRASAAWSPTSTGCGGLSTPCYVWKSPEGVLVEGVKPISKTEFENLTDEVVGIIDEVGGKPTTGIGSAEIEGAKTAETNLLSETDPAVLGGAEDALAAGGVPLFTGALTMAPGTLAVGWEIGGVLDGLIGVEGFESLSSIFGGSAEEHVTRRITRYATPISKGEVIAENGTAEIPRQYYKAPAHGFKLGFCNYPETTCGTPHTQNYDPGTHHISSTEEEIVEGLPKGFEYGQVISGEIKSGPEKGGLYSVGGYFLPLKVEKLELKGGKSLKEHFPSETVAKSSSWPTLSLSEARSNTASGVMENPRDNKFLEYVDTHDGISEHSTLTNSWVTVPNCDGLVYASCTELLEERGLEPDHVERGWETADPSKEPEEVLELEPARSVEVEKGTSVKVITNPDKEGMPVFVPAPGSDETYSEYVAKLNPALSPHEHILGEVAENPAYGPNAVTGSSPVAGTRVNPAVSTALSVDVNPAGAPEATTSPTSGWSPPTISAVSFAPLASVHIGCGSFPFGIFCWLKDGLTSPDPPIST